MRLVAIFAALLVVVGLAIWLLRDDGVAPDDEATPSQADRDAAPQLIAAGGDQQPDQAQASKTTTSVPEGDAPKAEDAPPKDEPVARRVFGRVVDQDGHPLVGITMEARPNVNSARFTRTVTDSAGRYELALEPIGDVHATGMVLCLPQTERVLWPVRQIAFCREVTVEVDFVLRAAVGVRGRLLGVDGKPVAGRRVLTSFRAPGVGGRRTEQMTVDGNGDFHAVFPRDASAVVFDAQPKTEYFKRQVAYAYRRFEQARDLPERIVLRLGEGHALRVHVHREDRKPISDLSVELSGPDNAKWSASVATGPLTLEGLPAGSYHVVAYSLDRMYGSAAVELPGAPAEIVLKKMRTFRVTVKTDAKQIGVLNSRGFYNAHSNPYEWGRHPEYDDWHLVHLPMEGKYAIVDPPDHVDEVEVPLKAGAMLSGVVEPRKAANLRFRRVRFRSVDDPRISFRETVNDDGTFAIAAIPPGAYEIDGEDDFGVAFEKLGPFRAGERIVLPWPR